MVYHSILVFICFLLDNALAIFFPTNYLLFGVIFVPSLTLCAVVLCSRDMPRLNAVLFSFLVGMFYDFFFSGTFILYACIFSFVSFLVSFWKRHLFSSALECFVICIAAMFLKDFITYFYAVVLQGQLVGFITWIVRYEASNIFWNMVTCIVVIFLYFKERHLIQKRKKRIRSGERILWYDQIGGE